LTCRYSSVVAGSFDFTLVLVILMCPEESKPVCNSAVCESSCCTRSLITCFHSSQFMFGLMWILIAHVRTELRPPYVETMDEAQQNEKVLRTQTLSEGHRSGTTHYFMNQIQDFHGVFISTFGS
jgi:hypothetical protein